MSQYTRDTIKLLVSARMDEVIPQGENLAGQVLVEGPDNYIEEALDPCAWELLQKAPKHIVMEAMFYDKKHFHGGSAKTTPTRVIKNSDGSATVVCPDNFLRLISIALNDSDRPIEDLMKDTDARKKLQYNKFLKGSKSKTKGALISFSAYVTTGGTSVEETDTYPDNNKYTNCNKAIQIWSTDESSPTLDHFHYVGKMDAEDIPDILIEPLTWEVAARALAITRQFDASKAAREQAMIMMSQLNAGFIGEN